MFGGVVAVAAALAFSIGSARVGTTGDAVVRLQEAQDDVAVVFHQESITATATYQLIDLSDNESSYLFKHVSSTGGIEISRIDTMLYLDDDTSSGTIKFGVMASSTPAGDLGTVAWFHRVDFDAEDSNVVKDSFAPYPGTFKTHVKYDAGDSSTTVNFLSNDTTTSSNHFATTTAVFSPRNYYTAGSYLGIGDLVMYVQAINGTLDRLTARVQYHTTEYK